MGYRYFTGTTQKNPLEYTVGETILFKLRAMEDDIPLAIPYISYSLIGDDGQNKSAFASCREDGWFYVEATLKTAGSVMLKAAACDEQKQVMQNVTPFCGSAAADIKSIHCATEKPLDYDAFWNSLSDEAAKTPTDVLYCQRIEEENPAFDIYDYRIRAPRDSFVSAVVAYPKNAKEKSLKLVIWFAGYGVRPIDPICIDGYVSVYVNAHGIANRESEEYYTNLSQNELQKYGYDETENRHPSTCYFAKMLLRDLQAVRFFTDFPLYNRRDCILAGSSQGGMQACNVAAHTDAATGLLLNVPWLGDLAGPEKCGRIEHNMPKGNGVHYFDTAIAAALVPCPTYLISGLGDTTCPPSTQYTVHNAMTARTYHEFYQNKGHSYTIPRDHILYTLGDDGIKNDFSAIKQIYCEKI